MLAISAFLEQGRLAPPTSILGRAVAARWERALHGVVTRRLALPPVPVVAVGGATLGGSGKTPLAVACAAQLARASPGLRVALVGHAYGARPGIARVVRPADALSDVGDEALVAACELDRAPDPHEPVLVVVGPTRQSAIDLAARIADAIVLDGVTQAAPVRASLALLAVDPDEPWGWACAVPPWGDLRAPVASSLAAVDRVVAVGHSGEARLPPGAFTAPSVSRGARVGSKLLTWGELAPLRVGLLCAMARPERVLRALARRGVRPVAVVRGPDHGPLPSPRRHPRHGPRVDLWLATAKCALHAARIGLSSPVATLEYRVEPGSDLAAALTGVVQGNTLKTSRNVSQIARGRGQHA